MRKDLKHFVSQMNEQHSNLNTEVLLNGVEISNKKRYKKWVWILAIGCILVLPVVANELFGQVSSFIRGTTPSVAASVDHNKYQNLDIIYHFDHETITFEQAVFDKNEIYLLGSITLDEGEETEFVIDPSEKVSDYSSTIGSFQSQNATINGLPSAYESGSFGGTELRRDDKGDLTFGNKKYFVYNFVSSIPIEYPATLSFEMLYYPDGYFSAHNQTLYTSEPITLKLEKQYQGQTVEYPLDKQVEIDGNKFVLEKLELSNLSTRLYVKANKNNEAYLGDLLFALNGEDTKLAKYYKNGLARIGQDSDEQLIFVSESRFFNLKDINELQLLYAGLIDKDVYHTTFNTSTLEVKGGKEKIKNIEVMNDHHYYITGKYSKGVVGPIMIREDEPWVDSYLGRHDSNWYFCKVEEEEIPVIFRGMQELYLDERIPLRFK